ncbi:L-threonine O-3-phosphate decarboxylase [Acetitomaculum ruminis DSM 5522]|uniref:L-threonine O-3-phosphate decarboxylase n=1 Tax=Acetitomaculum ruminis DSM 5522 TaxID=1120918 RepID=A0A1I0WX91_9FIRM|nr:threonine-phosphate decarboxylase [Acetitomaculum ruminis]SFA92780.1 L-threonine O-3-phosphate decarboxylase [Acetitomaculum ruminis DSM 5522]
MHVHGGDVYNKSGVIDFSANINLAGIPKGISDAAKAGVDFSIHYPDVKCRKLKEAISDYIKIPTDYIRCGNGAADIIFSMVFAKKPKKALMPAPSFYEYEQALRAVDCEIEYYILKEENEFSFDDGFIDALDDTFDIVFICNPNNPTGRLSSPEYLRKLLKKCSENNVLMVLDECFNDLIEEPEKYTIEKDILDNKNLLVLKAFTKIFAIPGLRLGFGLTSNKELLEKMAEVSQPWSVSVPAQMAGVAALKETEYVKKSKALIKEEKEFLLSEFDRLGIKVFGHGANYIFFKSIDNLSEMTKERDILIRDCSNYVGLKNGYYRIAVRGHEDNVKLISLFEELLSK